jgi:hypothetical protein
MTLLALADSNVGSRLRVVKRLKLDESLSALSFPLNPGTCWSQRASTRDLGSIH